MNKIYTVYVNDQNIANRLAVLKTKKDSMWNFFTSYMNDRFEFYREQKIQEFFDEYTLTTLEFDELIYISLREQMPAEVVDFIRSQPQLFCIQFSYLAAEIAIIDKNTCRKGKRENDSSKLDSAD